MGELSTYLRKRAFGEPTGDGIENLNGIGGSGSEPPVSPLQTSGAVGRDRMRLPDPNRRESENMNSMSGVAGTLPGGGPSAQL